MASKTLTKMDLKIIFLSLFITLSIACSAQVAFRSPSGLTVLAPPPNFGVTTIYTYVVTDGEQQWHHDTYNWRASIPVGEKRCKVYLLVREYVNQIQVNRKFFIFYEG
jgi:hypothetical protein